MICFGVFLLFCVIEICEGSTLTNFRLNNQFEIKDNAKFATYDHVLNETIALLEKNFLYRSSFNTSEWGRLRDEALSKYPFTPHNSIRYVLGKINDPYCQFFEPQAMMSKSEGLKGREVSLGLHLKRRWSLRNLRTCMKYLVPSESTKLEKVVNIVGVSSTIGASILAIFPKAIKRSNYALFPIAASYSFFRILPFIRPFEVVETSNDDVDNASIQEGDHILLVNGKPLPAFCSEEQFLTDGNFGDVVNITVSRRLPRALRANDLTAYWCPNELCVKIERDYVLHRTVSSKLINRNVDQSTAYIKIREFTDETFAEFERSWKALCSDYQNAMRTEDSTAMKGDDKKSFNQTNRWPFRSLASWFHNSKESTSESGHKIGGLIIDLRGNLGGTFVSALDVAAYFLPKGAVVSQLTSKSGINGKQSKLFPILSLNKSPNKDCAVLLLTDERTASASEILVEALCENKRALSASPANLYPEESMDDGDASDIGSTTSQTIVRTSNGRRKYHPMKTFGKYLAQAVYSLSDGSGLVFSIREFLTPLGRRMHKGHTPHLTLSDLRAKSPVSTWWKSLNSFFPESAAVDDLYFDGASQLWKSST